MADLPSHPRAPRVGVQVLVFPGCPHADSTIALVLDVAEALGPGVTVEIVTHATAETPGFRGSPTVLVEGVDLEEPNAPPPALGCRLYRTALGKGTAGNPPQWLLEAGILRALKPRHILFLCVANSARSQMSEGIARALAGPGARVSSAGSEPSRVRPQAIQALEEIGLNISSHRSKGIQEADDGTVDAVITLCAEEVCPVYLGHARRVHWGLPDPAGAGRTPEEEMDAFREIRDELRVRFARLFGTSAP